MTETVDREDQITEDLARFVHDPLGLMKPCRKCGKELPLSSYGNTKPGKGDRYNRRARCLECERAWGREHYQRTIDYQRDRSRKKMESGAARAASRRCEMRRKYGLTPEQVDSMKEERGHRCDICRRQVTGKGGHGLQVDHCHVSGKVRGLLCTRCNIAIGLMFDSTDIMRAAAVYVGRNAK